MTSWTLSDYSLPANVFGFIFNILLTFLILYLRYKNENSPLTQSQRWGLTLLGYLYLSNSLLVLCVVILTVIPPSADPFVNRTVGWLTDDFNQLASLFLLGFGLVYPRPVARWDLLRRILVFIGVLLVLLLLVQDTTLAHGNITVFGAQFRLISIFYNFAIFIPIFLWLPQYERQSSSEMRMVLSMMIWGYLLYFSSQTLGGLAASLETFHVVSDDYVWMGVLTTIALIYLARILYLRLGRWTAAEKMNLFFIIISMIMATAYYSVQVFAKPGADIVKDPFLAQFNFLISSGTWVLVRSTLFLIGLIRYQFFGPNVRADRAFVIMLDLLLASGIFVLLFFNLMVIDVGGALLVSLVAAVVVVWLCRGYITVQVNRLLPMIGGSKTASLAERRTTYMAGLQSAVVAGEISDPSDLDVLRQLRKDLRVSDREHELLMAGLAKEKPPTEEQEVEEVYLFHKGGTLLGYVLRHEKGTQDARKDMMVTMFTAVREFSKDALKKGVDYVGAIDYGFTVLIIEIEQEVALGVILRGKDNPQIRQRMRDTLRKINKGYSEAISAMVKGEMKGPAQAKERLKGLEEMLRDILSG